MQTSFLQSSAGRKGVTLYDGSWARFGFTPPGKGQSGSDYWTFNSLEISVHTENGEEVKALNLEEYFSIVLARRNEGHSVETRGKWERPGHKRNPDLANNLVRIFENVSFD